MSFHIKAIPPHVIIMVLGQILVYSLSSRRIGHILRCPVWYISLPVIALVFIENVFGSQVAGVGRPHRPLRPARARQGLGHEPGIPLIIVAFVLTYEIRLPICLI
jgi:hypothetical protein